MNKRTAGAVTVFLLGCVVGGGSSLLVREARAGEPTKIDQMCIDTGNWRELAPAIKAQGALGYQLVGYEVSDFSACFVRR